MKNACDLYFPMQQVFSSQKPSCRRVLPHCDKMKLKCLGPSDKLIEEGDILLKINDQYVNRFIRLEELLDDNVGRTIKVLVQRGFEESEYCIKVGDKHAITPDRYVQVSGARFNTLSYQLARAYNVPAEGVYVCEQSGSHPKTKKVVVSDSRIV